MRIHGFETKEHDHLEVWVELPTGTRAGLHFCPGDHPALDAAIEHLRSACADAVTATVMASVPEVPSHPPLVVPCRICDRRTPDNTEDERGFTFCAEHRRKPS